jgi:hypothetical protein
MGHRHGWRPFLASDQGQGSDGLILASGPGPRTGPITTGEQRDSLADKGSHGAPPGSPGSVMVPPRSRAAAVATRAHASTAGAIVLLLTLRSIRRNDKRRDGSHEFEQLTGRAWQPWPDGRVSYGRAVHDARLDRPPIQVVGQQKDGRSGDGVSQVEDLALRRRGRGPGCGDLLETPQLSDP